MLNKFVSVRVNITIDILGESLPKKKRESCHLKKSVKKKRNILQVARLIPFIDYSYLFCHELCKYCCNKKKKFYKKKVKFRNNHSRIYLPLRKVMVIGL